MSRPSGISDFAVKLQLVLDRLNWSRALLAQKVGVDKSVAQRWANGQTTPGGGSLVALTAAIQAEIADFTRADWRLPTTHFAARLGVRPAAETTPAAHLFPRAAAMMAETLDSTATRYQGFWLLLHASVQSPSEPAVVGYMAGITRRDEMLWVEVEGSVQGTWRAAGPAFPMHRLLYLVLEDRVQGDSLAFGVLTGVTMGRAMVLDGIGSSASSSLRGPAAATRMIGLRLDDDPTPPWREEALRRLVRLNAGELLARLPEALAARFRMRPFDGQRAMVLTVDAGASLACDDHEIAQGLMPEAAEALAAVRRLLEI